MKAAVVIFLGVALTLACAPKLSLDLTTVNTVGSMHVGDFSTPGYATAWIDATSSQYGQAVVLTSGFMSGSVPYYGGRNSSSSSSVQPSYWKNGEVTVLADSGSVEAIFVLKGDVYASGYLIEDGAKVPVFWKNTTAVNLQATGGTVTTKIYVSGDDIYVAGNDNGEAVYWKNGTRVGLGQTMQISDIAVVNGDIHIVGNSTTNAPLYGKNGNFTSLALTSGATTGKANSIFIVGTDVYVAGKSVSGSTSTAVYWKNGTAAVVSNGTEAVSIATSGGDLYILGYTINQSSQYAVPVYWKNNNQNALQIDDSHQFQVFHFATVNLKDQL